MNARLPLSGKDLEEYHRHTREEMEAAKQSRWGAVAMHWVVQPLSFPMLYYYCVATEDTLPLKWVLLGFSHEQGVVL